MTAPNTTVSIWKPLIFGIGLAMTFVAICAIVMALTWSALVASRNNPVFAETQPASQQDSLAGNIDVEDIASGPGGEDTMPDPSRAVPGTVTDQNGIAVWLTRMAIGLGSDSAVSYLAYAYSLAPPDPMSTTPTWAIAE